MSAEITYNPKEPLVIPFVFQNLSQLRLTELVASKMGPSSIIDMTSQGLEITPWKDMKSFIGKFAFIDDLDNSANVNIFFPLDNDDKYEIFRKNKLMSFVTSSREYLNSVGGTLKLKLLLRDEKKILGLAKTSHELEMIFDILRKSDRAGAFPNVDQIVMQYPGSFCPFPHEGHLEVTQSALKFREGSEDVRVLVSTFTHNASRCDQDLIPFAYKLDMLRRGFAYENKVTVMAVEGDSDKQRLQMEIISNFSSDKNINYVCGSDTLIKKVEDAKSGNECAKLLISPDINFYINVRKSEDLDKLNSAISYAKAIGVSVDILESPRMGLSGTMIRARLSKGDLNDNVFTNTFVKELYESSNPVI